MDATNPGYNEVISDDTLNSVDELAVAVAENADLDLALMDAIDVHVEQLEGRKRRIAANIFIPFAAEQVWQILTDYERLADFIPNLSKSQRLEHPEGGIRIEQIGSQSMLKFKFCARVVLDMIEKFPNQLAFEMVEGDFKSFSGTWQLAPADRSGQFGTDLSYTLVVVPSRLMPVNVVERRLGQSLRINLAAIHQRSLDLFVQ